MCSSVVSTSSDPFNMSVLALFCSLVQLNQLPPISLAHSQAFLSLQEPTSYHQASLNPLWVQAMEFEIQAL